MSPCSARHTAAFFDLDKTIIAKSSALAFALPLHRGGLITLRDLVTSAAMQVAFTVRGADDTRTDQLRRHLTKLCAGWESSRLSDVVAKSLHDVIDPIVYPRARELIALHRRAGHDVIIVSSSAEEVVKPIAAILGVDGVVATSLVVTDGKYTGEVIRYVHGPEKASAITELARQRGYRLPLCYAYSDSSTDAPMLEVVGHPCVVNPDRRLRSLAAQRRWSAVRFRRETLIGRRVGRSAFGAAFEGPSGS